MIITTQDYESCSEIRMCKFNGIRTKKLKKIIKNVDNQVNYAAY